MTARIMKRWWWHHRVALSVFQSKSMRRVLQQLGVQMVSDRYAGWRLPVSYLCDRMKVYLPLPVINGLLTRMANSKSGSILGQH